MNASAPSQTEWRPVTEFPGLYEVSNTGLVRRVAPGNATYIGRLLSPHMDRGGYSRVFMCVRGVRYMRLAHRLVAMAFLGEPEEGQQTRHLDGNPQNNHVSNLAWGSAQDNTDDKRSQGRPVSRYDGMTHCIRGHEFNDEHTYTRPNGARRCRTCHNKSRRDRRAAANGEVS